MCVTNDDVLWVIQSICVYILSLAYIHLFRTKKPALTYDIDSCGLYCKYMYFSYCVW